VHSKIPHVMRMFRAIEDGDLDDVEAYIASDYLNRESVDDGRSEKRGPEEFRETAQWLRAAFSDLRFETVDAFSCEDRVVVLAYMSGRHTAPFMGLPPTGRSFRQRQVHLFRMDQENKVREHLAQRDDLGLRRQLSG
jgi:steroid delta-isomerase-like uncharacterized protein